MKCFWKIGYIFVSFIIFGYSLYSLFHIITTSAPDFSVYYDSAKNLVEVFPLYSDKTLFTGFGYPPFTALFYVPITILSYPLAQGVWVILSYLCVPFIVYICYLLLGQEKNYFFIIGWSIVLYMYFPVKFTLGMGQSNLVALALLLLSLTYKKASARGFFLFLSTLIKPHFLIIYPILYLTRRKKDLLFAAALLIFASLVVVMVYGWQIYSDYYFQMALPLSVFSGREIYYNQGLSAFFSRIMSDHPAMIWAYSISVLLYLILLFKAYFNRNKDVFMVYLALNLLVLIEPLSWQHHFVFLIPLYIYLWIRLAENSKNLLFLAISFIITGINIKYPQTISGFVLGSFFLSHAFLGGIMLFAEGLRQT